MANFLSFSPRFVMSTNRSSFLEQFLNIFNSARVDESTTESVPSSTNPHSVTFRLQTDDDPATSTSDSDDEDRQIELRNRFSALLATSQHGTSNRPSRPPFPPLLHTLVALFWGRYRVCLLQLWKGRGHRNSPVRAFTLHP